MMILALATLCLIASVTSSPLPQQQQAQNNQPQYDPQLLSYLQQLQAQQQPAQLRQAPLQYPTQTQNFAAQQPIQLQARAPQVAQAQPQQIYRQPQQQQPSLLGVAYSSAADASKTQFSGFGVNYAF